MDTAAPLAERSRSQDVPETFTTSNDKDPESPPTSPIRNAAADALQSFTINSDTSPRRHGSSSIPTSFAPSSSYRQSRSPTRNRLEASPAPSPPPPITRTHSSPPSQPRNRSPLSRPHTRSWSASNASGAPPMTRTKSLPVRGSGYGYSGSNSGVTSERNFSAPSARATSPLRFGIEESAAWSGIPEIESICEDEEAEFAPRPSTVQSSTPSASSSFAAYQQSGAVGFSRRRRPSSPLHQVTSADEVVGDANNGPTSAPTWSTSSSSSGSAPIRTSSPSPQFPASRFNESFPSYVYASSSMSSSVPSTPTSTRSRSPSISSLETIPDSPDAEQAAIEEDMQDAAQRRYRSESGGSNNSEGGRRASMDNVERGRSSFVGSKGDRKRWSVCGAERRADFGLGTIWED